MNTPEIKGHAMTVTQDIIDRADQETTGNCMVAITIREQIPGAHSVAVDASSIKFNIKDAEGNDWRYKYDTPGTVSEYIKQFDDDKSQVKPFKVKLDKRQGYVGAVAKRGASGKSKHTKGTRECGARRCQRRFHGVVMTTKPEETK